MGDNDHVDTDDREDVEEGEEDTDAADDADESSSEEDTDGDEGSDDDSDDDDEGSSDEDESDTDDDADDGSSKKSKKGGKDDEGDDEEEGDEPPTRKPRKPADFVALRRGKQAAKAQKGGKGDDKGGDADKGDEDEDGLAPEDAAAIDRHLDKRLKPLIEREEQAEVETQIAAFVSQNPDFKPFAAKVQKWALHDAWKNVPIKQIFYAAAGDKLMQLGAKRGKNADEKARKGRTGGSSGDGDSGSKSWHDAPLEDVGKEIERVKLGRK